MGTRKLRKFLTGTISAVVLGASATSALPAQQTSPSSQNGMQGQLQNNRADQNCGCYRRGEAASPGLRECRRGERPTPASRRDDGSLVCPARLAARGDPQRAAGTPRGLIIAGAVASGLAVAAIASEGSNGRLPISN